jgi:hypothetical protein
MAYRSYLPDTDAALLAWSLNFSTRISAGATTYGLTSAQATAYAAVHASYAAALAAVDPGTRNKSSVAAKNAARDALKAAVRPLVLLVQGTVTVTDAQKLALGLTVRAQPSPIARPALPPVLDVVAVNGRTVTVRLHDAENAGKRGKPAYVKGAAVFSYVGAVAPEDPAAFKFEGNTTKTVVDVVFPNTVAPGSVVYLTAMWFNERAQSGPACTPVSTHVQFGNPSMAA